MDERRRYNALHAVNKAQIREGRPVNAVEVQRSYFEEGRSVSESALIQDIKELLSLGDLSAEVFMDAENIERFQRIAVTQNGHKFLYEMQSKPRPWLTETKKWTIGIVLAIVALVPAYVSLGRPKQGSLPPSESHTVQSFHQSGGITANTVVVPDTPARHLTDQVRADLDQQIDPSPYKGNPILIEVLLGNAEALRFAEEIKQYLIERGRRVEGIHPTMWAFPMRGMKISPKNNEVVIQIGSNE